MYEKETDEKYMELAKFFIPKCHPAVREFLKENPALSYCPVSTREPGRIYPTPKRWFEFGLILDKIKSDDRALTLTAKYILGRTVAVIFPKFYLTRWPKIKAMNILINHIDGVKNGD